MKAKIGIIMGSSSDMKVMEEAVTFLKEMKVAHAVEIVSAHRTPERMLNYAKEAKSNGFHVIVAAAGGAAHLPGMIAAATPLPVIGVPIKSSNSIDGWDSILSILQMPSGVPVATVALNGAKNAAILACQIAATTDEALGKQLEDYKKSLIDKVAQMNKDIKK